VIARHTGANILLVELFALFHDSCRLNDGDDYDHGKRAAKYLKSRKYEILDIPESFFEYLLEAISDHTNVKSTKNIHIATCWDADRLDLVRLGITPKIEFMNTDIGKRMALKIDI